MLLLASDEDVHEDIIRGLRRREPALDTVRVVDVGLGHTPDPIILERAAGEGRILVTGDLNSMVGPPGAAFNQGCPCRGYWP